MCETYLINSRVFILIDVIIAFYHRISIKLIRWTRVGYIWTACVSVTAVNWVSSGWYSIAQPWRTEITFLDAFTFWDQAPAKINDKSITRTHRCRRFILLEVYRHHVLRSMDATRHLFGPICHQFREQRVSSSVIWVWRFFEIYLWCYFWR